MLLKLHHYLICLLLACFMPCAAGAQVVFQKTFGGIDVDRGYCGQQTTDGGYIISGYTESFGMGDYDICLIKTNASGDTLWTKTYGGSLGDFGYSVQQTSDGGYILAGLTNNFGPGTTNFYLIKTDEDGDTLWTKIYGGSSGDFGRFVQQTTDGGYIITGYTVNFGAGGRDVYLVKTDSIGNLIWTRTYGGALDEEGLCVKQTANGGYIIAGYTESFGAGLRDFYLVSTDSNGDMLWAKTFGGNSTDMGYSVLQANDGGYVIIGWTASFGAGTVNVYLIKTDASGDTLWSKTYGGTNVSDGRSVLQTSDGGFILLGFTNSFGGGGYDVYMIKTNAIGDTLWTKTYGGINSDLGWFVQPTADGGYVITGQTTSFGAGSDIYLIKTDAWGNSGGCNEYNTNTIVGSPATVVGSGGVVGTGGVVNNTATIISSAPMADSVLCLGVGIEEQSRLYRDEQLAIRVYPNPFSESATVEISNIPEKVGTGEQGMMNVEVSIYDVLGRKVRQFAISNEQSASGRTSSTIEREGLESGVYIYKVTGGKGLIGAGKLIIN